MHQTAVKVSPIEVLGSNDWFLETIRVMSSLVSYFIFGLWPIIVMLYIPGAIIVVALIDITVDVDFESVSSGSEN